MTSTGNLISLWEIEASKLEESSMCNQTSLGKFGLVVRARQFDLGNRGQVARGTVLPKAWLPDQIARGQFWLHWPSLIY